MFFFWGWGLVVGILDARMGQWKKKLQRASPQNNLDYLDYLDNCNHLKVSSHFTNTNNN